MDAPRESVPAASPAGDEALLPPSSSEKRDKKRRSKRKKKEKETSPSNEPELLPRKSASKTGGGLLPETTGSDQGASILPPVASRRQESPESLPVAADEAVDALGEQKIAESEKVLLPDGKGGFTEVSERKTTVNYRGAKIELQRMKRDEKEVSRSLKNFFVITFCFLLLITLMILLSWWQGGGS